MFKTATPTRFLIYCLISELVVIVLVALCFILIHPSVVAGMVAGTLFLLLGGFICNRARLDKRFFYSFSFWAAVLHIAVSLIMITTRITHFDEDFNTLLVIGIPGPLYHQMASWIYGLLVFSTTADLYRERFRIKTTRQF